MECTSPSSLQPSVGNIPCSLMPSGDIDTINSIQTALPREIWNKIFNLLGFQNLRLFTEHKVKILKQTLNGKEDINRLMLGEIFIFHKKDFLNVVECVYRVALCCKEFYELTQRERKLLINAAQWARYDREFFLTEHTSIKSRKDENIRFKTEDIQRIISSNAQTSFVDGRILRQDSNLASFTPLIQFNTNVVNLKLRDEASRLLESLKLEPIKFEFSHSLKFNLLEPLKLELKSSSDDNLIEVNATGLPVKENQASTEQKQPPKSIKNSGCVIQ